MEQADSSLRTAGDDCVICLTPVSERAVAVPCNHCSFDFICLANWLAQRTTCPLCNVELTQVEYDWCSPDDFRTYKVKEDKKPEPKTTVPVRQRGRARVRTHQDGYESEVDLALMRRRLVYRHQKYSLHIGSNSISGFRNVTPAMFAKSSILQSRARKWIRRELRVFDSLRHIGPSSPSRGWAAGRMNNAEYLLAYIMEVLMTTEIKGGMAEDLLAQHLGANNTRLFLHELNSWLRSPFEELEDWDRIVQYPVGRNVTNTLSKEGTRSQNVLRSL